MIKDKIKELRKKRGLNQEEFAREIGTARQTVSSWENGKFEPDFENMKKIASFFDVTLDSIYSQSATKQQTVPSDVFLVRPSNSKEIAVPLLSEEMTACCGSGIPVYSDIQNEASKVFYYTIEELGGIYDEARPPVALKADGSCLEKSRIFDGDILIINPALEPRNWDPCVICWHDALSAKKVVFVPDGSIKLHSDIESFTVPADDANDPRIFFIWGRIVETRGRPRRGM